MAIVFMIPGALRELAGDRSEVRIDAAPGPLSAALARLWAECPAVRDRVITEAGRVRPHINIFVDGENIRDAAGLETPVRADSEVFI
ncbi:MAG TPA: MoaD/ThiS family protein, partial [Gemmatimonadaceae bacterium]|nr:MoaD/ThiS family protein [Gemmatimonadaceae bacterium]